MTLIFTSSGNEREKLECKQAVHDFVQKAHRNTWQDAAKEFTATNTYTGSEIIATALVVEPLLKGGGGGGLSAGRGCTHATMCQQHACAAQGGLDPSHKFVVDQAMSQMQVSSPGCVWCALRLGFTRAGVQSMHTQSVAAIAAAQVRARRGCRARGCMRACMPVRLRHVCLCVLVCVCVCACFGVCDCGGSFMSGHIAGGCRGLPSRCRGGHCRR